MTAEIIEPERSYADWLADAKRSKRSVLELGNELRERWPDWKADSPYELWEECCLAELGITAEQLKDRRWKAKASVAKSDTGPTPGRTKGVDGRSYPAARPTSVEIDRRRPLTAKLWNEGYSRNAIGDALGISHGTVKEDLLAMGIEGGIRPLVTPEPPEGSYPWRNTETNAPPPPESARSKSNPSPAACFVTPAEDVIARVEADLHDLTGNQYELSLRARNRLLRVLQRSIESLTNSKGPK
jgi:hypothetical protein